MGAVALCGALVVEAACVVVEEEEATAAAEEEGAWSRASVGPQRACRVVQSDLSLRGSSLVYPLAPTTSPPVLRSAP